MSQADRKTIEEILVTALELPASQQAAYVAHRCGQTPEIKKEVEELLAAYQAAERCIEPRAGKFDLPEGWDDSFLGTHIGTYKLIERIGDGGMGTVYRAERDDGEFKQVVAIKLVRAGLHDQELLRRLRSERQILALLEHPYIARLLDGGVTSSGQPYIVMEYIEGTRITDYAKSNHLTIAQRLELFRQICSAVHYAHQRLVVHRDIKPSNILVAKDGTPKLLDFGIAKILDSSATGLEGNTQTGLNPMTPEYASPEQLQGKALTTATDTYSLGVLLYELLTYQKPYRTAEKTPQEVARLVCESSPQRPSTAVAEAAKERKTAERLDPISSDLDHIVLKTIRKEPGERYASAEELSADVGNYLAGLPVRAREGSFRYLAGKLVARHKAVVVLSTALVVALIAGLVLVSWQVHVARVERARAQRRFEDVRKLANSLIFDVHDGVADLPGSTAVRKLIVQKAAEYLDSLSKESSGDTGLQLELANAYLKLGKVQGNPNSQNLGDTSGAEQSYLKAKSLAESVLAREPLREEASTYLSRSYFWLAYLYLGTHRAEKAAEMAQTALPIDQDLATRHSENDSYQESLAGTWFILADIDESTGNPQSLDYRTKALQVYQGLLARHPNDRDDQYNVSNTETTIGNYLVEHGSAQSALPHYQRAQELDKKRLQSDPNDGRAQLSLIYDLNNLADYYGETADWQSALYDYQQALEAAEKLAKADPNDVWLREVVIYCDVGLGTALLKLEHAAAAREPYQTAIDLAQPLTEHETKGPAWDYLGAAYEGMGSTRDFVAARSAAQQAKLLHKEACTYYAKAYTILHGNRNETGTAERIAANKIETDIKNCSSIATQK